MSLDFTGKPQVGRPRCHGDNSIKGFYPTFFHDLRERHIRLTSNHGEGEAMTSPYCFPDIATSYRRTQDTTAAILKMVIFRNTVLGAWKGYGDVDTNNANLEINQLLDNHPEQARESFNENLESAPYTLDRGTEPESPESSESEDKESKSKESNMDPDSVKLWLDHQARRNAILIRSLEQFDRLANRRLVTRHAGFLNPDFMETRANTNNTEAKHHISQETRLNDSTIQESMSLEDDENSRKSIDLIQTDFKSAEKEVPIQKPKVNFFKKWFTKIFRRKEKLEQKPSDVTGRKTTNQGLNKLNCFKPKVK